MIATRTDGRIAAARASVDRPCAAASRSTSSCSGTCPLQPASSAWPHSSSCSVAPGPALPPEHPQHGGPALVTGQRPLLQHDLRGQREPGPQQVGVGPALDPGPAPQEPVGLVAGDLFALAGDLVQRHAGMRRIVAAQRDQPHPDALHLFGREVVQPLPGERGGGAPIESAGLPVLAGVGQPEPDVLGRVGEFALHHPGVTARSAAPTRRPVRASRCPRGRSSWPAVARCRPVAGAG